MVEDGDGEEERIERREGKDGGGIGRDKKPYLKGF